MFPVTFFVTTQYRLPVNHHSLRIYCFDKCLGADVAYILWLPQDCLYYHLHPIFGGFPAS